MKLKNRLKAALESFLNPAPPPKPIIQFREQDPSVVMDNKLLAGKNVLVTGAGANIGKSIALEMAQQGANIYFTDIYEQKIQNLEQYLKKYNVDSKGFRSNISSFEEIDKLGDFFKENKIEINILVNNVGIHSQPLDIQELDLKKMTEVFDTNVFGGIYLTKIISKLMINSNQQGSIIFITSIHQDTIRRDLAYSSSKAALAMSIKELAVELAQYGIRVNGIAPGHTAEDNNGTPVYHEHTPLYKSSINPCYIGRAAIYLASDYFSHFTTGTIIKIDGGLSLYNHIHETYSTAR